MRLTRHLALLLTALTPLAALAAETSTPSDEILQKAFIPSDRRVHGEVRLLRQGEDTLVVQTLLYSASLRRGIRNMEKKEREAWPPSSKWYRASQTYIADLQEGLSKSIERFERGNRRDPRLKLLIELVSSPDRHEYTISELEISGSGDEITISDRVPIITRGAPAEYIDAQMQTMAATAFGAVPATLLPEE